MLSLTADNMVNYALYDEDPIALKNAIYILNSGQVSIVGFSGKKASGKDTIAEIFKAQHEADFGPVAFAPFAAALKSEASNIISFIHNSLNPNVNTPAEQAQHEMTLLYNFSDEESYNVYHLLKNCLATPDSASIDGWTRTEEVWAFLRMLGTDIRQPQDKIHWVRRTVNSIVNNTNNGISTFCQDTRFIHEAASLGEMGAYVARIDIDPRVQALRLKGRDGVEANISALTHSSETELDHYSDFDIRVDNSVDGNQEIVANVIYRDWLWETKGVRQ